MTYPPGSPGYPPAQPPGQYGSAPTTQFSKPEEGPSKLPVYLLAAVVVLGLAGYLASYGPVLQSNELGGSVGTGGGFEVVALVLAALLAAVGLLPKQRNFVAVVAVIAVLGFLLALSELFNKPSFLSVGWALIVIVVLSGLQALAAIGALLLDAGVVTPPAPRPKYEQPKYDQYAQYGGPGQYYGQPGQPGGQHQPHAGQQNMAQQRPAYPQYGGYPPGPSTGGFPGAGQQSGPPTGYPTFTPPPHQGPGAPTTQIPAQAPGQQESPSSTPSGPAPS
jgi:hypothetical protein